MFCRRIALALATLTLLCLAAARAADWPVPRGPSHEPEPYRYDPAAWKQVPKDFLDDAAACVLYAGSTHLVEADGTVEVVVHEITRLNGRKGIDSLGEYRSITYDPAYETLTLNEARVHKAAGPAVPIEPRHVQLRDMSTDYQVYDHEKQLIISFPNLEVGDVLEVKWTVRGKNPEHAGQFFTRYTFGDDRHPVVRDELRVRLPRERTLKHAASGGRLEPEVADGGETRTYRWQVRNRRPLPQDDNLPPREALRLQVAASTFASWDAVGTWKQQLRADCWECTPEVRRVVKEVTRDLHTPAEKARALTFWVRRNVRYVSVGETHDYTPHPPAQVLANRFGDCKDQSQLLAVMLREAGVPVALATLGVRGDGQVLEAVPSPWGTHAILLVTLDGKEHWIDTTVSLAGWDHLPRDDRDRLCYVVDDHGLRLLRTPPATAADNRVEQTTVVSIGADGSSRSDRTATYHGAAALGQRDAWVEEPPGERRRLMTSELQDAHSRAHLVRLSLDEKALLDFDRPVSARVEFEVPDHFSGASDREGTLSDSKLWGKLLSYTIDYDREAPLDLGAPFESRHRFVVLLPAAYKLEGLPRDRVVRSRWGAFTLKVKADPAEPRRLELEMNTRLDEPRVEPADFDAFRKFQEDVTHGYRVWLTLRPADDLDDAPALEAVLARAPDDSASALVLARLYQQNTMAAEARRVLRRARHYRPNDAALGELAIKTAETLEEEEAAYRELVRRFPEEPKYAVSLGATLINRGKYAQARAVLEPLTRSGTQATRGSAHFQIARSYFRQDKADKALHHLEEATKADVDVVSTAAALQFRGRVLEKLDRKDDAAEAYRLALKLDADAEEALLALVRLDSEAGRREEALDHLRRYTLVVAHDLNGLATAADWHLRLGRLEDAAELAARARALGFHDKAQRVLGLVSLHQGKYDQAVLHLAKATLDGPALDGLLRAHLALGNLAEAEAHLGQAAKMKEAPAELRQTCDRVRALAERRKVLLAEVRVPAGKEDAVRKAADRCVCAEYAFAEGLPVERVEALLIGAFEGGVDLGPAFALRGQLLVEKGRLTRALADGEKAVALSPKEARGWYVRGRARLERGGDGAVDDLEKAAELGKRKDATVLHWLAAALARAGRSQEAVTVQREAVKCRPDDPELREQLEELERSAGE